LGILWLFIMDIDLKIMNLVSQSFSSSFPVLKVFPPSKSFYKSKKPLPKPSKPSTLLKKPLPSIHSQSKPNFFLTQFFPKPRPKVSNTSSKIFKICLKPQHDRKRDEITVVSNWIQELMFFYPLSSQKQDLLSKNFESKHFRKGEFLFTEKEKIEKIYFLLDGYVEIFEGEAKCGNRQVREIVGENSFVEDLSTLRAKAKAEVHCLCIETVKMLGMLEKEPVFVYVQLTVILKSFLLFKEIPFLKLFGFSKQLSPLALQRPSCVVYEPGESSSSFFVLVSGQVKEKFKSFSTYEDIKLVPAGSVFGTREYLLKIPRRSLAQATGSSQIFEIHYKQAQSFLKKTLFDLSKQENIYEVNELHSSSRLNSRDELSDLSST